MALCASCGENAPLPTHDLCADCLDGFAELAVREASPSRVLDDDDLDAMFESSDPFERADAHRIARGR